MFSIANFTKSNFLSLEFLRRYSLLSFATLILVVSAACSDDAVSHNRDALRKLESQGQVITANIQGRELNITSLNNQLSMQHAKLNEFQAKVYEFMMNHKMAVTAIAVGAAGTGIALDPNNEFSEEAKKMGGLAAGLALGWAVFHADEVVFVLDELVKADAYVKSLKSQIMVTEQHLKNEVHLLQEEQIQLERVYGQITQISAN